MSEEDDENIEELGEDEAAAAAAAEEEKQRKKNKKKWECRKCGQKNDEDFRNCSKCGIDKMIQFTMKIKRKKYCDDCNHLHMYGHYCHMYVLAEDAFKDDEAEQAEMDALLDGKDLDELDLEDLDEDEDEDEDEEDDDDAIFGAAKRKTNRMAPDGMLVLPLPFIIPVFLPFYPVPLYTLTLILFAYYYPVFRE